MMGWGMDLTGWLWMGAWIVALLAMVWLIVRGTHGRTAGEDAMGILRARFARGEISEEEFQRARLALSSDRDQRQKEIRQ
jgi:putative membrane protein